jgi:hypothetical protein
MYHALLEWVFGSTSFEEAIKNDGAVFLERIAPLYKLGLLNEKEKDVFQVNKVIDRQFY